MEKEKNNINNGVNIIIAVFVLEVVGLIIVLFLVLNDNLTLRFDNIPSNDNQTTPPVETIPNNHKTVDNNTLEENDTYVGEYTYTKNYEDNNVEYKATLSLEKDGTFYIKETATMKKYYYGTYEVFGDTLKLNYIFEWANAKDSYSTMNKKVECSIKNNTISSTKNVFSSEKDITLTKTSNNITIAKEFIDDIVTTYKN